MKIYEMAVKRPVTTIMLIFSLVFFGAVSFSKTPVDMLPSINMPIAVVMTTYDAGPEEVESIVTANLETAISRVPKIKTMQSSSSDGTSVIVVQFEDGVDMDSVTYKIDQYVSMAKPMLPEGVSDSTILSIDPNMLPVLNASISHDSMTQQELYRYMQNTVLPMLESTSGVSNVSMSGGVISHVEITVKQEKLLQYGFALNNLISQLQAENLSLPGGMTAKGDINLNLKVDGKFKSLDEIENLTLISSSGTTVRLKDMATVKMAYKEPTSIFRSNGQSGIAIAFDKESTANVIETAKAIKERLKEIEAQNPGLKTHVTQDQSIFISDSINNVMSSAISGVILAVLVLLFFLKDIKTSLIVGIAMPISIISTFTFLYMLNITINLLSLGGLTFAVGMLVDNSIIVIENIFRYIQLGENRVDAAIKGTKEVFGSVFASTITNIAIFLPIVFTGGMIGDWLSNLALTITVSLLCSLLVSVSVIPMFAALFISDANKAKLSGEIKGSGQYIKGLKWSLNKRGISLLFAVVFSIASIGLGLSAGLELMPSMDSNSFSLTVNLDQGTRLEVADKYGMAIEEEISKLDYVADYHTTVGSSGLNIMAGSAPISMTINTKPLKEVGKSAKEIAAELESLASKKVAGGQVVVSNNGMNSMMGGMADSGTVYFNLSGLDLATLSKLSDTIVDTLEKESYVKKVTHSYEEGLPYISVEINSEKAALYGLTTATIANTISTFQKGTVATRYSIGGYEIDVTVKTDTDSTKSIEALNGLKLATPTGQIIPLSYVATLEEKVSPATISKTDKIKTVSFEVELNNITMGEAKDKIEGIAKGIAMPTGYSLDFTGSTKELMEAFYQMLQAIIIGVVLIYMVLAAQFESFKQPLIIMVSIPFSFTGGFIFLALFRLPLSVPVLMGMLMIVGIIVNNAILIVDTINQFMNNDDMDIIPAIISTCQVRLRPIILTTTTTILGLIPMAIGFGGNKMLQPLAVFVCGGLIFGTVLTMVIVPVLYLMTDKRRKDEKTKEDLKALTQK